MADPNPPQNRHQPARIPSIGGSAKLWNQVHRAVDATDQPGQFLLVDAADEPGGADLEWFG